MRSYICQKINFAFKLLRAYLINIHCEMLQSKLFGLVVVVVVVVVVVMVVVVVVVGGGVFVLSVN